MNLLNTNTFNGYPVISSHGVLIENILLGNERVVLKALNSHKRVCIMRFELKFPSFFSGEEENISKFFDSLRFRIKNDLFLKIAKKGSNLRCELRYIWVKELSAQHGWHYHVAVLLNNDVYNCLGKIGSDNINMFNRILYSWASALGCSVQDASGLVHIPVNPIYKLNQNSSSMHGSFRSVMYRLSYFAKVKSKPYGSDNRMRFYGTSRR